MIVKQSVHQDQYHHQHCLALQPVEIKRMANLDVILSSVTFKHSTVKKIEKTEDNVLTMKMRIQRAR